MEYYGRRNRRRRDRRTRQSFGQQTFLIPSAQKRSSFLSSLSGFFIMTSLLAIIYLMLDYHCATCKNNRFDRTDIIKDIDYIAQNITHLKECYNDLEAKVLKFSHELPKIEGQIEMLEAVANTMERGDFQRPEDNFAPIDVSGVLPKCAHEDNAQNINNNVSPDFITVKNSDVQRNMCAGLF